MTFGGMVARMSSVTLCTVACLFGSAGTFNWPEAWLYWVPTFLFTMWLLTWLRKHNPQLLKDRMNSKKKFVKRWDKLIVLSMIPCAAALFVLPGLDAVRYGWSEVPLLLKTSGFAAIGASLTLIFLVMRENTFLSRVVEIQKDRGHKVVSTGPYRFVRHPLYLGSIALYLGLPLALGSLYSLIPAACLSTLVVLRTMLEDRTLQQELEGYIEYTERVKYRLFPGAW